MYNSHTIHVGTFLGSIFVTDEIIIISTLLWWALEKNKSWYFHEFRQCEFDFFFSRTNLTSSVCSTVHYHHYNTPRTNTRTNRQELVYYYSVLKLLLDGHPPSPRGCWRPPRTTTVVLGWGRAKTYRTASICTTFNVLFPSASGLVLIVKTILISYKNIRIWFVPHIASRWIW